MAKNKKKTGDRLSIVMTAEARNDFHSNAAITHSLTSRKIYIASKQLVIASNVKRVTRSNYVSNVYTYVF